MNSKQTRKAFLDFFESKAHKIVPSAPIVNKDDPSLMFTNAGMNQFKDFFLGNEEPKFTKVADSQKCLRVSGKHNDLEEVGFDGYHHTMFEMLGNWSFGDYFKKDAIDWAWEFLTDKLGIDQNRLYVTVFEGDSSDGLGADEEAESIWSKHLHNDRILRASKKDNFWEMGETGPCGPCSEIHMDMRSEEERKSVNGAELVNKDHPEVIEIWNLVFIQYNRNFEGALHPLPAQHIDTGMGFERLCMVLQNKNSSYDTDVFTPYINKISEITGVKYNGSYDPKELQDVAFRVVVDHLRAVVFAVADGQIPSNTGAGYVIRRILRRAVRYYYSFLNWESPLLVSLVPELIDQMGEAFPELTAQQDTIAKVVEEEELSFLKTLEKGLKRLDQLTAGTDTISGQQAFELYDTYGFPLDLTLLIAEEKNVKVDEKAFDIALNEQRNRSRADAQKEVRDWVELQNGESTFVGYDELIVPKTQILKYRPFTQKGKSQFHIVLDTNPFYAEGGGQIGDTGTLTFGEEVISVENTIRENDLYMLIVSNLPQDPSAVLTAAVDQSKRGETENNHTATHLLHSALRTVLGDHVHQKGSLVTNEYLRFDFSHFSKMSEEEILRVEDLVNEKIRMNIAKKEDRNLPIEEAQSSGAMMLFGEKYGDQVRMITFDSDYSVELCGGCHVNSTGQLGLIKVTTETSVAAGVRRIEAVSGKAALTFVQEEFQKIKDIAVQFKNPHDLADQVSQLIESNKALKKDVDKLKSKSAGNLKGDLLAGFEEIAGTNVLVTTVDISDSKIAKDLIFQLENQKGPAIIVFGLQKDGKPQLMCRVSEALNSDTIHAGKWVKQWATLIRGGGGGQPFFATAGGSDASQMTVALDKALEDIKSALQ